MVALVDCNSFFCSVEKAFHPGLEGKPVCVLSSNDGCIVALTPEAKAVGLRRGDPLFKVQSIVDANKVQVFSGNITLYAAMSERVTSILRNSIARVENYSIDESFCYLDGYEKLYDLEEMMRDIVKRIRTWTDIPVSVGIAPTKTLAKLASRFAKKYKGYRSVCVIDTEEKRRRALALSDLVDVWGVGRGTLNKLHYYGISTPLDFADKSEGWVRSKLNIPGTRVWQELNGVPCVDTTEIRERQSICTSRSFGEMVGDINSLKAAISSFTASCCNKLRAQRCLAGEVTVFMWSNRFREDLPQYSNMLTLPLLMPTADTLEISKQAMEMLQKIYRPGILYKKAGVILGKVQPSNPYELQLFDPIQNRQERAALMRIIDDINHKYGLKRIHLAVEDEKSARWHVKSESRTPNYLTDIHELLKVNI